MNKLLIISGPTATGKTALAVKLAQKYNGELISADSRQIYRGLDIGVGKDHPVGTPIHLIDLITPDKGFSAAEYRRQALTVITNLHRQGKLPILVGCTGFYIDSIINQDYHTFSIKPNLILRSVLNHFPLVLNQFIFKIVDRQTFYRLNNSDLHNPYRLIRKIEIALSPPRPERHIKDSAFDALHLSLTAPSKFLYTRIDKRVEKRLTMGHLNELGDLLKIYHWSDPGLKVSAYASFHDYLNHESTLKASIQKWKFLEHRDARRQKTWFKKRSPVIFIDISKASSNKTAGDLVRRWYNNL